MIDRLRHMFEAADAIVGYTERGRDAFDSDAAVRDAVVYQIVVLGEAAKAVVQADPKLAESLTHDGIEWSLLARMRDRLTHQYWRTDAEIVWGDRDARHSCTPHGADHGNLPIDEQLIGRDPWRNLTPELTCKRINKSERSEQSEARLSSSTIVSEPTE